MSGSLSTGFHLPERTRPRGHPLPAGGGAYHPGGARLSPYSTCAISVLG
ncbi:hypothetical protein [Nocardia brasiliensis]|nr:hypothetical protein [Nocardia brasiliensis]